MELTMYRCPRCKKLFFKARFYDGSIGEIEVKCSRCKKLFTFNVPDRTL